LRATADRPAFYISTVEINHDQTFYSLSIKDNFVKQYEFEFGILLNNTLTNFFFREFMGGASAGLGLGVKWLAVYEMEQLPIIVLGRDNVKFLRELEIIKRKPLSIFEELGFPKCTQKNCNHPEHPYEYVKPEEVSFDRIMPDRRELDKIVFEVLGLTEEEQLEVYRAVLELVKNRLLKAKSK